MFIVSVLIIVIWLQIPHSVTLTNTNLICVNASRGLYTVQIMDNQSSLVSMFIYELLENITMNNGIDLEVAIIRT